MTKTSFNSLRTIEFAIVIGIVLVLIGLFTKNTWGYAGNSKLSDPTAFMRVMKNSGVSVQDATITSSSFIGRKPTNYILSFTKQIEQAFSLTMNEAEQPCCSYVRTQYNGHKNLTPSTTLRLKLVGRKTNGKTLATYLLVELTTRKTDPNQLNQYHGYLSRHLNKLDLQPKIKTSIQGVLQERLNHDELYAFLLSMFEKLDGEVTEGLNEKKVISLTGLSEKLHGFISSQDKKMNLQIAGHVSVRQKKTVITIGTPVITMSY